MHQALNNTFDDALLVDQRDLHRPYSGDDPDAEPTLRG
jgi:hypothetical protein